MTKAGTGPGDADVVRRVLAGERDLYRVLVRRYSSAMFGHALQMTGSEDAAEDIVQEAFVRGYTSLSKCNDRERVGGWLFRIAANLCTDRARRRTRRGAALDVLDAAPSELPDPEKTAYEREMADEIDRALQELPAEQRQAFLLKHVEQMSYEEMAEMLDLSVPALKMRVHRARTALQGLLEVYR